MDDSSAVEQAASATPEPPEAAPGEASASQQTKESPIPEAAAPEAAPASGPSYTGGTYVSPAVPPHPSYVSSHEAAEMLSPFALFGVLFAYLIPVVGQILAIIWAVGKTSNPFLRNLSRGYLLLVAVLIVFAGFTALSGFLTFLIFSIEVLQQKIPLTPVVSEGFFPFFVTYNSVICPCSQSIDHTVDTDK